MNQSTALVIIAKCHLLAGRLALQFACKQHTSCPHTSMTAEVKRQ